jgi:hypothetical protein
MFSGRCLAAAGLRKGDAVHQGVVTGEGAKALATQNAPHLGGTQHISCFFFSEGEYTGDENDFYSEL